MLRSSRILGILGLLAILAVVLSPTPVLADEGASGALPRAQMGLNTLLPLSADPSWHWSGSECATMCPCPCMGGWGMSGMSGWPSMSSWWGGRSAPWWAGMPLSAISASTGYTWPWAPFYWTPGWWLYVALSGSH